MGEGVRVRDGLRRHDVSACPPRQRATRRKKGGLQRCCSRRGRRGRGARRLVAAAGAADERQGEHVATPAKLSGSINVWIMDPGSPKVQSVVKGYGTRSRPSIPARRSTVEFVPWAQAPRQVHDRDRRRQGRPTSPRWARRGRPSSPTRARSRRSAKPPSGEYVSSLVDAATLDGKVWGKPWYAGSRALIYRKDVLSKAGMQAAQDLGRADRGVQGDQGQGPGHLPDRLHRADRAHVPADHLAGAAARSPRRTATPGSPKLNTPQAVEGDPVLHRLLQGGLTPRPRSAGRSPTRRRRSSTATSRCSRPAAGRTTRSSRPSRSMKEQDRHGARAGRPERQGHAFAGGSHLVVFKGSKDKDLAKAFVDYMLEPRT